MAIPRAAIDLIGADHLAHELLEHKTSSLVQRRRSVRRMRPAVAPTSTEEACSATNSSASSQVVSTKTPSRRISGWVRRSAWLLAWKPKNPRAQRSPLFRPAPCAEFTSMSSFPFGLDRDPAAVAAEGANGIGPFEHPGRYSYIDRRLVMAPTGQI